jgi:hypothetical protein
LVSHRAVYLIYKSVTGRFRDQTPYAHLQSEETSLLSKGTEERKKSGGVNEEFKVMARDGYGAAAASMEPKVHLEAPGPAAGCL